MTHYYRPDEQHRETHHLECPRCGHHSVIRHGEGRYACLNCHWQRNVSRAAGDVPPLALIFIVVIIILLMISG